MGAKENQKNKPKNKRRKINLVFNEEKRRDFLNGFHKRKLERQKRAREELAHDLKEERKRLKQDARDSYKKLVVSYRPIPELENLHKEEYDDEEVSVKVVELSTADLARQNNWIGVNQPIYDDKKLETESEEESEEEEVPGMELKAKPVKKEEDKTEKKKTQFDSLLEMKRTLKKKATKNVQKSKAFQKKNKLEQQRNRKKSQQQKKERVKLHTKRAKHRGKRTAPH